MEALKGNHPNDMRLDGVRDVAPLPVIPPDALNFDPRRYRVDIQAGEVDGRHVGILNAMISAIIRHEVWIDRDTAQTA